MPSKPEYSGPQSCAHARVQGGTRFSSRTPSAWRSSTTTHSWLSSSRHITRTSWSLRRCSCSPWTVAQSPTAMPPTSLFRRLGRGAATAAAAAPLGRLRACPPPPIAGTTLEREGAVEGDPLEMKGTAPSEALRDAKNRPSCCRAACTAVKGAHGTQRRHRGRQHGTSQGSPPSNPSAASPAARRRSSAAGTNPPIASASEPIALSLDVHHPPVRDPAVTCLAASEDSHHSTPAARSPSKYGSHRHFVTFTDEHSRYTTMYPMKVKSEVPTKMLNRFVADTPPSSTPLDTRRRDATHRRRRVHVAAAELNPQRRCGIGAALRARRRRRWSSWTRSCALSSP